MIFDRVHLVFCLFERDRQSPYPMALAAAYCSIRQRTTAPLTLHVIADQSVSKRTRRRLDRCMRSGDRLQFYPAEAVPEAYELGQRLDVKCFSPAIVWRAWIPDYLPHLNRCILLDCDLLVLLDIRQIWSLDLQGMCLSAFQGGGKKPKVYYDWIKTPREQYFRVPVCLMNLRRIRKDKAYMQERLAFLEDAWQKFKTKTITHAGLLEQSLFNRYFSQKYLPLPFPVVQGDFVDESAESRRRIKKMFRKRKPMILDLKGWQNRSSLSISFWSLLLHTPWWECASQQKLISPAPPQSPI